jgi:hypothetical protein
MEDGGEKRKIRMYYLKQKTRPNIVIGTGKGECLK